jgi:hypothetical protein
MGYKCTGNQLPDKGLFGCSAETVFQQELLAKTPASAGTVFKKQRLCSVTKTMM